MSRPPAGTSYSRAFATACSVTSAATVCSNVTSPMTCSAGRPPVGSASMRRFTSRPTTVLGWNDSCATAPVLPSPSNGSMLPGTARPEASASSIVFPVPHRVAAPLSRSPPLEFLERLALLIPPRVRLTEPPQAAVLPRDGLASSLASMMSFRSCARRAVDPWVSSPSSPIPFPFAPSSPTSIFPAGLPS